MKISLMLLARIGSKRIPNKLLRLFYDKPLIEHTLQFMNDCKYEGHVYTDSKEIKKICHDYKIYVHDKILENKEGIHRTKEELLFYNGTVKADIIVLLQATSPYRDIKLVEKGIKTLIDNPEFSIALSSNKIDKIIYNNKGKRIYQQRDYNNKNFYHIETGSFYIFRKEQLEKDHITDGKRIFCISKYDIDLDTLKDWQKAELLVKGGYYEN